LLYDNGRQMGQLIDDLLGFSRLGRQPLRKQRVNSTEIVRLCLSEQVREREGGKVEIVLEELPPCDADPGLLKQVWNNLISNALKYTIKRQAAKVMIGSTKDPERGCIYFVRDNGVGFDMQYSKKLFQVFQRLHRADEFEGTGVGLAVVQRIVQRHGGKVWAEAQVDCGATFFFTLSEPFHSMGGPCS
jgi:light-regulated signal transduction histidine kinase (bacteriophytochrome)